MRLRFLLRPSWLALTLVVFIFATACFTMLAPWQFGRHDERSAQNSALRASLASSPRPLDRVLADGAAPDERTQWSLVTITGRYLPEHEMVARLRIVQGEPAYEVLTPLRTPDGQVLLIDRGYVHPDERTKLPAFDAPPPGEVELVARARVDEPASPERGVVTESAGAKPQVYRVSSKVVGDAAGLDIRPGYFQLEDRQPGVLGPLPLPRMEAGPFFSYALQWIAFGVMALLGWLYFTVRELRPGGALADPGATARPKSEHRRMSVAEQLAQDEREDRAAAVPDANVADAERRTRQPAPPS